MKAISFASSIVLAGALFVSAGTQAQESPYEFWLEDKTSPPVEDLYSQAGTFTNEVADPIQRDNALFSLLGSTYGGDGRTTFRLPDLRGRAPVHQRNKEDCPQPTPKH
ncbi:MAG: tail fiber protein, partial [Gammaproteobacteria bacterium]|nr:tail fiber protein [Gammaproteobacteria bacterium]